MAGAIACVTALLLFASCATSEDANPQGGAPEDAVRATLADLSEAVHRKDLDDIVAVFSPDYSSQEATGKSAVRDWWTRVLGSEIADDLTLDMTTAEIDVDSEVAEVTYFDERGELACHNLDEPCTTPQPYLDFRLERDNQGTWLITGIPSENR
ncbi:MAG: YybH family protein [Acidimicrobiales bacterium]